MALKYLIGFMLCYVMLGYVMLCYVMITFFIVKADRKFVWLRK